MLKKMTELTGRKCCATVGPQVSCRRTSPRLRQCVASKRPSRPRLAASTPRRTRIRAYSGSSSFDELEITRLPFSSRQAVMQAVDALGRSATAAEVASEAGLSIHDTERCLQAIANESGGNMKVRCHAGRQARPVVRHRTFLARGTASLASCKQDHLSLRV